MCRGVGISSGLYRSILRRFESTESLSFQKNYSRENDLDNDDNHPDALLAHNANTVNDSDDGGYDVDSDGAPGDAADDCGNEHVDDAQNIFFERACLPITVQVYTDSPTDHLIFCISLSDSRFPFLSVCRLPGRKKTKKNTHYALRQADPRCMLALITAEQTPEAEL